jgi:hypothetical protein
MGATRYFEKGFIAFSECCKIARPGKAFTSKPFSGLFREIGKLDYTTHNSVFWE